MEQIALEAWGEFDMAGETAERVERVLDVRQGKLCWVTGTIYVDMPLKPNILDDISKDVSCFQGGISKGRTNVWYSTGFQHHRPGRSICRHLERTR